MTVVRHQHQRGRRRRPLFIRQMQTTAWLVAIVSAAAGVQSVARAEEGDGGDPSAVNLRVAFPAGLLLAEKLDGTVRASSEANGPQTAAYSGAARFGIDRSGPGLKLRSTVAKVPLSATVSDTRDLKIRLTSDQVDKVKSAARRAHKDTVVLNVVLRGETTGRSDTSKANAFFRVRIR